MLYKKLEKDRVSCFLCEHRCLISPGKYGICNVRRNHGGTLMTEVYGEIIAANIDPIEKKPLFHYLPGSLSFSVATIGCNFRCSFCQNWQISQANKKNGFSAQIKSYYPEDIIKVASDNKCQSIAYTYTEPTIFFEFAYDTARLAKESKVGNIFVTNGYMTPEAIHKIRPYLDAANIDLKSLQDDFYKDICKARLEPVLNSIRMMNDLGIWIEVTTLVVPGQNDSDEELTSIARFIANVNRDIPWHISRYHPDFEFDHSPATPLDTLKKAVRIGKDAGLHYIYIGNLPGESDTTCPNCGEILIQRSALSMTSNKIKNGRCPSCGNRTAGIFSLS